MQDNESSLDRSFPHLVLLLLVHLVVGLMVITGLYLLQLLLSVVSDLFLLCADLVLRTLAPVYLKSVHLWHVF